MIPGARSRHQVIIRASEGAQQTSTENSDDDELPLDLPRRDHVRVAMAAVRQACRLTQALQPTGTKGGASSDHDDIATVAKADLSPVTVADFAAQALVLRQLHRAYPADAFIAEESSGAMEADAELADQVLAACVATLSTTTTDGRQASTATTLSMPELLECIDLGKQYESWKTGHDGDDNDNGIGTVRPPQVWCLDPIDGTKGFLRGQREGGQYCVALALLEDGVPTVGILGCPNLPVDPTNLDYAWRSDESLENNAASRGCLFVATRGGGCYQIALVAGAAPTLPLHVTPHENESSDITTTAQGRFCVGVEKFSDALGQCAGMARVLHGDDALDAQGEIVQAAPRIDSQAKYGVLARAGAEYYVRLTKPDYVEWIWDHAAGLVVLTEAGGSLTDTEGRAIDFSLGAKMSETVKGVLGSNGGIFHAALVDAYAQQEAERLSKLEQPSV